MLDGLDRVAWDELEHAYGTAEDMPGYLRQLLSDDPEEWVEGIDALYATICHQTCTVYQATGAAVLFLIELLVFPEVRCRGAILRLLADIARAMGFLQAHGSLSIYEKERETEEFRQGLAREAEHTRAAHAAVWRGLDLYLRLLADPNPRLRVTAPYTLGFLARYAGESLPEEMAAEDVYGRVSEALAARLDREEEPLVRASLTFGLGALAPRVPENLRTLRDLLSPACSAPVRVAAALCLAEAGPDVPVEAVEVLAQTLEARQETGHLFEAEGPGMEERHHPLAKAYREAGLPLAEEAGTGYDPADVGAEEDFQFPWLDGGASPHFASIQRLGGLGPEHEARMLQPLLKALEGQSAYAVDRVTLPILRFVFQGKMREGTRAEDLTAAQRAVLETLYQNPLLWATDSANPALAFMKVGLPTERREWTVLLGVEERPYSEEEARRILETLVRRDAWRLKIAEGAPLTEAICARVDTLILRELGGDEFVPLLARFPNLKRLDIGPSRLTDSGLASLPELSKLSNLSLVATPVTDAGLGTLARFPKLKELNLSTTAVTDAGLEALAGLERLRELYLYNVEVSPEAVARLRRALPKLKVQGVS